MPRKGTRTKRRERRVVSHGRAYIQSTFNNTVVTLTDQEGAVPPQRPPPARPWTTACAG